MNEITLKHKKKMIEITNKPKKLSKYPQYKKNDHNAPIPREYLKYS